MNQKIVVDLYKSIIRSKLVYGSFVYLSAKLSILKLLDTIPATSLRIALCAFKTVSSISVLAETLDP